MFRKISILIIICTLFSFNSAMSQDERWVSSIFKTGNPTGVISSYLDDNIDITIQDQHEMYSKSQAEFVLNKFFSNFPIKQFSMLHSGSSGGLSKYYIGKLKSNSREYRVFIYTRQVSSSFVIQELKFEN